MENGLRIKGGGRLLRPKTDCMKSLMNKEIGYGWMNKAMKYKLIKME